METSKGVTQADRDAAWSFRPEGYGPVDRGAWNSGLCDHNRHIQAFARHRLAHTVDATDGEDYKLPCDVRLPPATVIRAGCPLSTLKVAMEAEYRPTHFEARQPAAEADEVGRLREALRPFAEKADKREAYVRKTHPNYNEPDSMQVTHRLGDFRAARTALNRADNAEGGLDLLDEGGAG